MAGRKTKDGRRLLSIHAYAKHRKDNGLPSSASSSIQRAIANGRIARTCVEHDRCPVECIRGGIDPVRTDVAMAEFAGKSIRTQQKTVLANDNDYANARKVRELYESRIKRLEFEERIGALVPRDEMKRAVFELYRRLRDTIMAVPRRVAPRLSTKTNPTAIRQELEDELRKSLSGTFDGEGLE